MVIRKRHYPVAFDGLLSGTRQTAPNLSHAKQAVREKGLFANLLLNSPVRGAAAGGLKRLHCPSALAALGDAAVPGRYWDRLHAPGAMPNTFLKAREKDASDS